MMSSALQPLGLLVGLASWLVPVAVGLVVTYWVIRLAVRHGVLDAHRMGASRAPAAPEHWR